MASFLLSECLEIIFSNLIKYPVSCTNIKISTKDLYPCPLVSRHWCRISTPFLYAYPFHNFDNSWNWFEPDISYFKLIRTLLSCIPQSEIEQIYITSIAQAFLSIPIPPTFNYISFIRGSIVDEEFLNSKTVLNYKEIWLSAHNPERISSKQTIGIMNHLVKFICKHCNNLTMLELPITLKPKRKSSDVIYQFISLLSLQKRLQHIILLPEWRLWDVNIIDSSIFNLLSTQSEILRILEFKYLSFCRINKKALNLLCLLNNIRELKLYCCKEINNLNSWAKCLTKLKVLDITLRNDYERSGAFLIQLFQSSSNTLTKLVIVINNTDNYRNQDLIQLFQQIPLYLRLLNYLELSQIFPTELISIFKSCTQLVYLNVILNDDENLKILGKFIPKTLEKIKFKLLKRIDFKESLRCFLEDYMNNSGALKCLEFRYNEIWLNEYKTEQFGIQIIEYSP